MQSHRRRTAVEQLVGPPVTPQVSGVHELQARTRGLISNLASATVAERLAIREEVVILNLPLASAAARRYGPMSEFDDLVQIARRGLVEAFDRFDPEQSSYATFAWITMVGLLRRHLRDHGWSIRPPRSLQESANQLRKVIPELTQDLGRTPRAAEAAARLGWTSDAVHEARLANQALRASSLEALVGDSWMPEQPPEWDRVDTRLLLERALDALSREEQELLWLRFRHELSQAQIGVVLGLNQMGVSRRLTRVMLKLRALIGDLDATPPASEHRAAERA